MFSQIEFVLCLSNMINNQKSDFLAFFSRTELCYADISLTTNIIIPYIHYTVNDSLDGNGMVTVGLAFPECCKLI